MLKTTTEPLLTIGDVSVMLNIPIKTLRQWVYRGQIPNLKLNGVVRFSPQIIEEWIAQQERAAGGLELPKGSKSAKSCNAL